jgi:hypothetical protein
VVLEGRPRVLPTAQDTSVLGHWVKSAVVQDALDEGAAAVEEMDVILVGGSIVCCGLLQGAGAVVVVVVRIVREVQEGRFSYSLCGVQVAGVCRRVNLTRGQGPCRRCVCTCVCVRVCVCVCRLRCRLCCPLLYV